MKSRINGKDMPLVNENIHFDKMQVISHNGENLGILTKKEALKLAADNGLDLVLMAEKGGQGYPVVKIMDFGKALYAKKKQQASAKKHQKIIQVKEIKIKPKIGEHDYQTKINQMIDFLKSDKHVKVTLLFRGREAVILNERGKELFDKINNSLEQAGLHKVAQEKDVKSSSLWSRVYYIKH